MNTKRKTSSAVNRRLLTLPKISNAFRFSFPMDHLIKTTTSVLPSGLQSTPQLTVHCPILMRCVFVNAENSWKLSWEENGQHVRATGWQEHDVVYWWHQHAEDLPERNAGHVWARQTANRMQRVLQCRQARGLRQRHRFAGELFIQNFQLHLGISTINFGLRWNAIEHWSYLLLLASSFLVYNYWGETQVLSIKSLFTYV